MNCIKYGLILRIVQSKHYEEAIWKNWKLIRVGKKNYKLLIILVLMIDIIIKLL